MTKTLNALVVLALLASILGQNPWLFLLAVLLGLLAGITALWDRYALANIIYARHLGTDRLFVGEETDLIIEVTNAKPLPLAWFRVEDEFPIELELRRGRLLHSYKGNRRLLPNLMSLRFYERVRKHYRVRASRRGALEFGPAELRSGDVFGFRIQERMYEHRDWLTVYPKVVPVTALGLPAENPFGSDKTPRRVAEDPLRIASVREYVPGDSPRMIHWKASARRGGLQTKVFDPGAVRTTAIFLDIQTMRGFSGIMTEYLEYGITAAASVARCLLDDREAVGLYVNGCRRYQWDLVRLPPSRRTAQWTEMLEALAWLIGLPSAALQDVLHAEMLELPFGAGIVAISANPTEAILGALLDCRRTGHPVTLLAIGEEPPANVPRDLRCYWIGGNEAWANQSELHPATEAAGAHAAMDTVTVV